MKEILFRCGYEACNRVDRPLTFAARGGIIDVFSINYDHPIRIEFFDTEIDSIRFFDIATQRTIETIDEVSIIPATTTLFSNEEVEQMIVKINSQLEKDSVGLSESQKQMLHANIEEDIQALIHVQEDAKRYRYYAFAEEHYGILDYCSDQIVFSSIEDIENNYKRIQEENNLYIAA